MPDERQKAQSDQASAEGAARHKPSSQGHPMTPDEIAESSRHPQQRIREADNRPDPNASTSGARGVTPEPVGDSAGPDTSGAVAKPAAERKPGASSKLGGTPGANATRSTGRQTD